ncbi:hypothetical protein CUU66_15965 [Peribacillus deserti]|uniref:Uncharacterized protein n=1 Tax=Peribacillus deserti TaxID=673318 RepID=A0A2N5M3X0_9BACI|nr:hypothetical protein CUU66_15965 [Peribacillus deserti]
MERKVRDSCGSSGTGETLQAKPRLTDRPAESKHPHVPINSPGSITRKFTKTARKKEQEFFLQ